MRLWLDDLRPAPPGWTRAHSVNEAKTLILAAGDHFEYASLDHDLGDYEPEGGDGFRLTQWMTLEWHEDRNVFPRLGIRIHSANPRGVERMLADVDDSSPYEQSPRYFATHRGATPPEGWPPALMGRK